jgi:hypothetical protein
MWKVTFRDVGRMHEIPDLMVPDVNATVIAAHARRYIPRHKIWDLQLNMFMGSGQIQFKHMAKRHTVPPIELRITQL